jgi:hypothetical protein
MPYSSAFSACPNSCMQQHSSSLTDGDTSTCCTVHQGQLADVCTHTCLLA